MGRTLMADSPNKYAIIWPGKTQAKNGLFPNPAEHERVRDILFFRDCGY
jgi:hypothetical protein